ncbi:Transposable element Tc1 transposase [Araneus ventricosus]|uniref:Transposable element Tc1 transposase n=1 Tax=Araneus ventricosus TaxID=182803 RepID=A0A4Y2RG05_ARAVE|nr:Transposable element Tc1 transposase [Araneus ventricosus]
MGPVRLAPAKWPALDGTDMIFFKDLAGTVHDCWQLWPRKGTASRRPGSGRPRGTTEREDRRARRMAVAHGTASAAEIRTAVGTTVTQRTVTNRLLQGQLRDRRPVACIPLTPNHCRLRREWCQARAHWRTEWISVVFSDETRLCLGASDGHVLVRRRPGERLQPTCLRPRHTGHTPGIMVRGAISYGSRSTLVVIPRTVTANLYVSLVIQPVVLPFMNSIQRGVFQQDKARPHTVVVTQHALQSVYMLPWPARSPYLSPMQNVWVIIMRQLQRHPQPALTVPVLTDQVQQTWNSVPQTDIQHAFRQLTCCMLSFKILAVTPVINVSAFHI